MSENVKLGSTGKYGQINFDGLKGGIKKSDIKDDNQIKLFDMYDKNSNGILEQDEIATLTDALGGYADHDKITRTEAKRFARKSDLKDVKGKEVLQFLNNVGVASDKIVRIAPNNDGIYVEYKPDAEGSQKIEVLDASDAEKVIRDTVIKSNGETIRKEYYDNGNVKEESVSPDEYSEPNSTVKYDENGLMTEKYSKNADGIEETLKYGDDGQTVREKVVKNGTEETTTKYNEDGTFESAVRKKGAITEHLDENGRVTKKITDLGDGVSETVDTEYDEQGNITKTTTTKADGTKIIDDGTTETTINPDGTKSVKNKATGEVTQYDAEGNPIQENYTHKVEFGDTWYGIVQAKYGITDHKKTMEIVHQLKAHNNVDPKATNMPKEVELPATVTLNDGTEVPLADKDAVVDKKHNNLTNPNHPYNKRKAEQEAKQVSMESVVATQSEILEDAKKALEAQLASDGWAGKVADKVSILWNSDNRAEVVQREIEQFQAQLDELSQAQAQGDDAFKAKFKEIFGVEYNEDNIREYQENKTPENYKKAYGTKNDIATRVNEYNRSQVQGAEIVKGTVVTAGVIAAGVATGGAGVAVMATTAGLTAMGARATVELTDLATNDVEGDINQESVTQIAKQSVKEGVITGVTVGLAAELGSIASTGSKVASSTAETTSQALVKTTTKGAAEVAVKSGATTAGAGKVATGAGRAVAGALPAGEVATSATSKVVSNLASKVGQGGIKSLTTSEISDLASVLKISPDKIASLTRKDILGLIKQFHPDRCSLPYASDISSILNNMLQSLA